MNFMNLVPGEMARICPSFSNVTHDSSVPGIASNASTSDDKP